MGVNVRLELPARTRMMDVANVVGLLLGCARHWDESQGARWVQVKGVSRSSSCNNIPEMAYINIKVKNIDNPAAQVIQKSDGDTYALSYHFEGERLGGPTMIPKSTPAKIALCKAVVIFFGGRLDYNDCDSVDVNLVVEPRADVAPTDGKAWNDFQEALWNIKPLTQADIDTVARWAAY